MANLVPLHIGAITPRTQRLTVGANLENPKWNHEPKDRSACYKAAREKEEAAEKLLVDKMHCNAETAKIVQALIPRFGEATKQELTQLDRSGTTPEHLKRAPQANISKNSKRRKKSFLRPIKSKDAQRTHLRARPIVGREWLDELL
ncbi:hypothetical protein WDW86_07660 [Bdellovibrionota bacterium FG-2]